MHKENLHHFSPVNLHWVELLNRRCVLLIRLMSTDQALALFQSVSFTMWIKQNKETQFQRTELSQLYLMRTLSIVLCVFFCPSKGHK